MTDLIAIVMPVFGLVAIGYLGALVGIADERMGEGLSDFLFVFATPVLLFKLIIASSAMDSIPIGYWVSYYAGMAVIWAASMLMASRVFHLGHGEAVISGLGAGQSNTVLIGIPIIIKAYGDAAALPIALLLAVNLPITMTTASVLLERNSTGMSWTKLATKLVTHPILIGIGAGILCRIFDLRPDGAVKTIVDLLSNMAIPGSLLALGMAMRRYGLRDGLGPALTNSALRLLIHPAIAYVLAFHIFKLPPVWAGSVVLFASMPAGINVYLFAARYGEGQSVAASTILLSTALAVVSTALWLRILGIA